MEWRKPPEDLVDYFHTLIPEGRGPVEFRPMFGAPCYWSNGNMFAALRQESVVVRLGEADRAALLAEPGAALFEPMEGRPMREYVVLPSQIARDPAAARSWLTRGLEYAASLPPKVKKPRKPRTSAGTRPAD